MESSSAFVMACDRPDPDDAAVSVVYKTGKCPDCGQALHAIRIIDATEPGFSREGSCHVDLSYTLPEAEPSFWSNTLPVSGVIRGFICEGCRRIFFYGVGDPIGTAS